MIPQKINILLADDDQTDCLLFKDALDELPVSAILNVVNNGEQLIEELTTPGKKLPDVLFLDINMPRKNGFACLGHIKRSTELQNLPVIIFTSASDQRTVKMVFRDAASYFICKPADYTQLKKVIYEGITLITQKGKLLPNEEKFRITGDSIKIPDEN